MRWHDEAQRLGSQYVNRQGQLVGAILVIMQKPCYPSNFDPVFSIEFGYRAIVRQHFSDDARKVKVKNLRSRGQGMVAWSAFRAVNARSICGCGEGKCYSVYHDFKA
jgi:hypothetical protein